MDRDTVSWLGLVAAMPKGNKYRQWYAMRQRMRQDGSWDPDNFVRDRQRTLGEVGIDVPSQAKRPRLEEEVDDSEIPELESCPTPEGNYYFIFILSECPGEISLLGLAA